MKKSMINDSLKDFKKQFPDNWMESISILKLICEDKSASLMILNMFNRKSLYFDDSTKHYSISYFINEIKRAKNKEFYKHLNFVFIIRKKTNFLSQDGDIIYRTSIFSVVENGLFIVDKEKLFSIEPFLEKEFYKKNHMEISLFESIKLLGG